jgi:hypothetical protein
MSDGRTAYAHVAERYRKDMDGIKMTSGEFDALSARINQKDFTPMGINYQVGNLDRQRHEAMMKAGVVDSKIMVSDSVLYHGIANKNTDQKVPSDQFKFVYQTIQTPEKIFEDGHKHPRQGRIFHFIKDTHDGKVIKIVLEQKSPSTALRIVTIGKVEDHYGEVNYKKIW